MVLADDLAKEYFFEFALASYTNTHCHDSKEFEVDLTKIKYIKMLLWKYKRTGVFEDRRIRLALNNFIIFYNVFLPLSATRMLFLKCEIELYPVLKAFLTYLNFMPLIIPKIAGNNIASHKIKMDQIIYDRLQTV